mgnify:CR=1 FL=1
MAQIIPAILSATWSEIEDKIKQIDGLTEWVQIDVADGHFVPAVTWATPDDLALLPGVAKIEIHLMIDRPEEILAAWMNVADRVVIHIEATDQLADIVDAFGSTNTKLVLALELDTPLADVLPYAPRVAAIQLMGIRKVGFQGESFDPRVLDRVRELKTKLPGVSVQVDGGIDLGTGRDCVLAGADALIVGSALWESGDAAGMIAKFKEL